MDNLIIRELEEKDLTDGFLTTLNSLREVGNIDKEKLLEIFKKIKSNPGHHIIVAEMNDKIVGTTTLLIEPKFIHQGGFVGHIEDVAVDKKFQNKKIGEKIIKHVLKISENNGCYKTILDCSDSVKPFYEKLGFKHNSNELRYNHF